MKLTSVFFLACAILLHGGMVFTRSIPPASAAPDSAASTNNTSEILKAGEYDLAYTAYNTGRYKTAFESARKRAENGDPAAQTLLGVLYMEGKGVIRDENQAMSWYARAAEAGDPQAQLRYGVDLYNGLHGNRNQQKGEEYIRKAAEAGLPSAYFYYGQILMDNAPRDDRFDIGLLWFLKGASGGDADAAYAAGQILSEGTPRMARNDKMARTLLEIAANGGNIAAQIELAKWMIDGRGGEQHYKGAFDLMKIASVNGVPLAQMNLARLYHEGMGTKRDLIMAAAWYMVARQMNVTAKDLDNMMNTLSPAQIKQAEQRTATLLVNP